MGDWAALALTVAVTAVIVFLPGLLVLRIAGLRGIPAMAFAPVVSVALAAVAALVLGFVGVPWSALSLAVVLLVAVALVWLAARRLGGDRLRLQTTDTVPRWLLPLGLSAGSAVGIWRLIAYIQDPAGISQTNDAVFHMNAIRHILDTGDASSLNVNSVIGADTFYPAAWHAIVSVVASVTAAEIPISANAFTLIIGAVVWPLGLAWFALVVTGSRRVAALTAVLSPVLQLFPLLMFQWGVLFPNALSVALLPAVVAAIISLPQWSRTAGAVWHVIRGVLFAGVGVAALALAQPASLPVLGLVIAVWASDRLLRVAVRPGLAARIALTVLVWLVLALLWRALAGGTGGSHWPPFRGKWEAVVDVLLNGQMRIPPAWAISVLMLAGLVVVAVTPALRWLGVAWLGLSALYILVASVGMPLVRDVLLAPWYADPYRIAAFAPLVVIPLAAIGLDRVFVLASARYRALDRPWTAGAAALIAVVLIVFLRPVPMPAFIEGTFDKDPRYLTTDESYLSLDERHMLEALPDYIGEDERVIANPSTGSGFGYMLSGRDVYPRTWSPPDGEAWAIIAARLRDAGDDPSVCTALDALGDPRYVLDFGDGERGPGRYEMPGMTDFAGQDGFEKVADRGDVSLWRISACGG